MGSGASSPPASEVSLEVFASDDFPVLEVESSQLTTSDQLARSLEPFLAKPFRLSAQEQDIETLPELDLPGSLVSLDLTSNNGLKFQSLQGILSRPSSLHELLLPSCPNLYEAPLGAAPGLGRLLSLDLSFISRVKTSLLLALFAQTPALQKLALESCEIPSLTVKPEAGPEAFLLASLSPTLQQLNLGDNLFDDITYINGLSALTSLKELDLREVRQCG